MQLRRHKCSLPVQKTIFFVCSPSTPVPYLDSAHLHSWIFPLKGALPESSGTKRQFMVQVFLMATNFHRFNFSTVFTWRGRHTRIFKHKMNNNISKENSYSRAPPAGLLKNYVNDVKSFWLKSSQKLWISQIAFMTEHTIQLQGHGFNSLLWLWAAL